EHPPHIPDRGFGGLARAGPYADAFRPPWSDFLPLPQPQKTLSGEVPRHHPIPFKHDFHSTKSFSNGPAVATSGLHQPRTNPMSNLSGKTALVTGASRGIGRATALELAKAGAQVLVHYSTSPREAEAVVAEITKAGGRAQALQADLALPDGAHDLARQTRAIIGERLDILVANAGAGKSGAIEETTVEDF